MRRHRVQLEKKLVKMFKAYIFQTIYSFQKKRREKPRIHVIRMKFAESREKSMVQRVVQLGLRKHQLGLGDGEQLSCGACLHWLVLKSTTSILNSSSTFRGSSRQLTLKADRKASELHGWRGLKASTKDLTQAELMELSCEVRCLSRKQGRLWQTELTASFET